MPCFCLLIVHALVSCLLQLNMFRGCACTHRFFVAAEYVPWLVHSTKEPKTSFSVVASTVSHIG